MRSITKLLARLALVLCALGLFSVPALAAAPSNDTFAGARLVTLGFNEILDTTEATTDDIDAQLLQTCEAPAAIASVWYALDGDGSRVLIDGRDSDYTAALIVVSGSPGNFTLVTCGAFSVAFDSEAGTRYYVMAFDLQDDGGGNGGALKIAFSESLLPDLDFSVDSDGRLNSRRGSATISGSYTCTAGPSSLSSSMPASAMADGSWRAPANSRASATARPSAGRWWSSRSAASSPMGR
jgi:hypothetical protein